MTSKNKKLSTHTLIAHTGKNAHENFGIPAPPLYRTSTILSSNMNAYRNKTGKYTYGRNGTPTTDSLSLSIAKLTPASISASFV